MENDYSQTRAAAKIAETRAMRRDEIKYLATSIAIVLALLAVWQLAVQLQLVSTRFFDSPISVFQTILRKIGVKKPDGGVLIQHIWASAEVVWLGFFLPPSSTSARAVHGMVRPVDLDPATRCLDDPAHSKPRGSLYAVFLRHRRLEACRYVIFTGCLSPRFSNLARNAGFGQSCRISVARLLRRRRFRAAVGIPSAMPMVFAGAENFKTGLLLGLSA